MNIAEMLAAEFGLRQTQVDQTIALIDEGNTCTGQSAETRNSAASAQKLAAGAHRVLCIKGEKTKKLVLTGNTFTGLKNCDAVAAVEISGIADVKGISDNKVDTNDAATKIKVGQSTSPTGFSKK